MIRAGIIGASGYTGQELIRLLIAHPETDLTLITSRSLAGKPAAQEYGNLTGLTDLVFTDTSIRDAAEKCDVLFLALPHGVASHQISGELLKDTVIIDLGADYRLHDREVYETWYKCGHGSPELLGNAVYGLPELHREAIRSASLIANPGCYTTSSILSLAPLFREKLIDTSSVIIDAKSGVSGAGRAAKTAMLYGECSESIKAYGIASHRHTPEIEQELSLLCGTQSRLTFTPHLIPMNRGILTTSYARTAEGISEKDIRDAYKQFYHDAPFVRLLEKGHFPETRWVKGSNFCDISLASDSRTGRLIVLGAIDNLIKGASGQAVQNMNIRFGLDETMGLQQGSIFPI